jgi:hypothetical protein
VGKSSLDIQWCSGDPQGPVWHYVPVLARKPGALRNGAPFKDWVLPAAIERVRRKLAGADDGNRQMVDILNAVLTDGLPPVEAACADALGHGVHSADVVLNILARQREPAPPANIMTPAACRCGIRRQCFSVRYAAGAFHLPGLTGGLG